MNNPWKYSGSLFHVAEVMLKSMLSCLHLVSPPCQSQKYSTFISKKLELFLIQ